MKIYYFLFGSPEHIKGLCSLASVNVQAARYKAENDIQGIFGLQERPVNISADDFTQLATAYMNNLRDDEALNLIAVAAPRRRHQTNHTGSKSAGKTQNKIAQ